MAKINTLNYQTVASWNGSQDLFVVEQTDGTKVATPEQIKQYVLNDMDEVPTENSGNPVKSGGIYSKIGDLTQTGLTGDSVAAQLGALKATELKIGVITSSSVTVNAGWHQYVDIRLSEALPNGTVALFVTETSSPANIFANYYDYDPSTLKIRIGVYNTSNEAVTGTFKVAYLYI